MKYLEKMYIDSQIFAGDMDGSESNFTEKVVKIRKPHKDKRINCDNAKRYQI